MIGTKYGVSLLFVMPESFVTKFGKDSTVLSCVSEDHFHSDLLVRGSVLLPTLDDDTVTWSVRGRTGRKFDFYEKDSSLLNPDITFDETDPSLTRERGAITLGQLKYSVLRKSVEALLHVLYLHYQGEDQKLCSVLPEINDMSGVPYMHKGKCAFVAEGSSDRSLPSSRANSAATRVNNRLIKCGVPGCNQEFQSSLMRQHAAWHLLHDKLLKDQVGTDKERLCGLCAAHPAIQYTSDHDKIDGCPVWLEKPKGT